MSIATGTPHAAAALEKAVAVGQKACRSTTPSRTTTSSTTAVAPQFRLPGQDAGIDFAREDELAKGMVGVEPKA